MSKVSNVLSRYKKLSAEKQNLTPLYALISEYVFNRKFNTQNVPNAGIFTSEDIYDNSAQRANSIMSNVMVNNIWPNGPRTFSLGPTWDTVQTEEVKS